MPKQLQAPASSADSTLPAAARRRFRFAAAPSSTSAARFAVSMLFTVDGFAFGMWAGHIAAIRAALDLSPAALSLALFGLFTGAMASMPLTGALSRRFASRRLSIAGAVLSLPALALPGLAGSLGALIAATIAFGASRGVLEVAMNTVASELQERVGRPIFSSFHACFSFGGTPHRLVNEDTGEASSRWQRFIVFPSNCRRRADVAERANEEARTAAFV
jgi:hypothetical protein